MSRSRCTSSLGNGICAALLMVMSAGCNIVNELGKDRDAKDAAADDSALVADASQDAAALDAAGVDTQQLDGSTADGSTADGSTADAGTADAATADGSTVDGSAVDGSAADGLTADGTTEDGSTVDAAPSDVSISDLLMIPDAAAGDLLAPDSSLPDQSAPDLVSAIEDAGEDAAIAEDAGEDAGAHDAGVEDAGAEDAPPEDTYSPPNTPPVAEAGDDQTFVPRSGVVTLDGTDSYDDDNDDLTYSWTQTDGATVTLSDPNDPQPTFTAPSGYDELEFTLVVNDGQEDSVADTVHIYMHNSAPTADAGATRIVRDVASIALDGSGSDDPDGDPLFYTWNIVTMPAAGSASFDDANVVDPVISVNGLGSYAITLRVSDGVANSALSTVTVNVTALPPLVLADTGQTTCYDASAVPLPDCPVSGQPFHGQDAQYSATPVSFTSHGDGTVTDNNTGLMWEAVNSSSMNWYQAAGVTDASHNPSSLDHCAAQNTGTHTDWRLPSMRELLTIVDYTQASPTVDTSAFTFTPDLFWAREPHPRNADEAWRLSMDTGAASNSLEMDQSAFVVCVRGTEASPPLFVAHDDGTVSDDATGLMWTQEDALSTSDWQGALGYCEVTADAGGYTDWRLPSMREAASLLDWTSDPPLDPTLFVGLDTGTYWSSTSLVRGSHYEEGWTVVLIVGGTVTGVKSGTRGVMCVRDEF